MLSLHAIISLKSVVLVSLWDWMTSEALSHGGSEYFACPVEDSALESEGTVHSTAATH